MEVLREHGRVKFLRTPRGQSYIYYFDKKPQQLDHVLATNWVFVSTIVDLCSWERLIAWENTPQQYRFLVPDAFFGIHNTFDQSRRFYFLEIDRSENKWDKTEKYEQLYQTDAYLDDWWVKYATSFPKILCVTATDQRRRLIEEDIRQKNASNLAYEVKLLTDYERRIGKCGK